MAGDSSSQVTFTDNQVGLVRRRIKAHRKSRQGCLTCKGRRVKCCEARPECKNCTKSNLSCVYPDALPMAISSTCPNQLPRIGRILYQSRGYGLRDMRFFHNFITVSFPHLPLESDAAWRNEVPMMAQEHEFLMHALLALGASHLHARTDLDLTQTVEKYRMLAMRGLTDLQSNDDDVSRESRLNAQLATAYCLTFCASYMGDPMNRFLILVRGCSSLTGHVLASGYSSPFFSGATNPQTSADHLALMKRRLENAPQLPHINQVELAKRSLNRMAATCFFTPIEWKLLTSIRGILEHITEPFTSYQHLIYVWDIFTNMNAEDFAHFTNSSNATSVLLQAHFLAVEELLRPWTSLQLSEGRLDGPVQRLSRSAAQTLPAPATLDPGCEYSNWPADFIRRAYDQEAKLPIS